MDILRVKVNGEWTDIPAIIGPDGITFIPSVDSQGNLSWSNTGGQPNPPTVNIKGPQGQAGRDGATGQTGVAGTTFIPYVASNGDISWSNADGKPNPATVNIKGPQGAIGPQGPEGPAGTNGQDGDNGYSPTASVSKSGDTATITITDKSGTTSAQISDGAPGVSPSITVTDITGGHRVTITDATGAHSFDVMDGQDGQGAVQDVQVNGVSVLQDGVANVPYAGNDVPGVFKTGPGIGLYSSGKIYLTNLVLSDAKKGTNYEKALTPHVQHSCTFYGLAKAAGADMKDVSGATVGVYPEAQKSAIHEMLNGAVSVSGTTPTITALPGVRYVCGEVATLEIVLPESGIVDVTFESGSTPTVLTVTPPTGVTLKWANGFDPSSLEANTAYEINIMDGLGVAVGWT